MNRPHVTQVLWTLGRAGAERVVFDLTRKLADHGYRVSVIAAAGGGEMEEEFKTAGISVAVGPAVPSWQRWRTVAFLRDRFKKDRPDILHTHLGADVWGGMAARRQGIKPWVITSHSDESKLLWRQRLMRRGAFLRASQVVCVSNGVRQTVRDTYHVPVKRLSVIRNGVDLERFTFQPRTVPHPIARLLCVSRLVPGKNLDALLMGLAKVDRPWRLNFVGSGPEEANLKHLAQTLGIAPRVHFTGSVSDVTEHLKAADLLCFPSKSEGQGMALIEAAANGLPAVASNLPVFREVFDERSVLFAFSHSFKAWARAVEQALQDYPAAIARARNARAAVEQNFSLDGMVTSYADLYFKLLNPDPQF